MPGAGASAAARAYLAFRAGLSGYDFDILVIEVVNLVHAKLAHSWPARI